jgi:hypothetical protein
MILGYSLLGVSLVLQIWLSISLLRREQYASFRFFSLYTFFAVAAGWVKTAVYTNYRSYFITYWVTEPVYVLLGTLAIFETFPLVFKSFSWIRQFRLAVCIVVGLMVLISVLQAIFAPPIQAPLPIAAIYSLGIAARYTQGGTLVAFLILSKFYGIHPRRYAFGVLLGFWLLVLGFLIPAVLRSELGTRFNLVFKFAPGVVYIVAVFIWLITFSKPEPPDPFEQVKSPLSPEQMIERIRRMTRTIKGPRQWL